MTITEKNVQTTQPWIIAACRQQESIFAMFTVKRDGQIQLYRTDEISIEDFVKQLRHIVDALDKQKILIVK